MSIKNKNKAKYGKHKGNKQRKTNHKLVSQKDRKDADTRREPIQYNGCMTHTRTYARRRFTLGREFLVYLQPRAIPDSNYFAFTPKCITSTTPQSQNFRAFLSAQPTPFWEFLCRSNQCGFKTYHACYGDLRCNLNLARRFRLSLPVSVFGRLFFSPNPRNHKSTPLFAYCSVSNPRV